MFARVDGGKQLLAWNKADALAVNEGVVGVLLAALRAVRGGYLCRVQEGELKYMVAFYDPQVRGWVLGFCGSSARVLAGD
jgi:hypothetical protein